MSQPEMKVDSNGRKFWYLNDKLHREDGPAIEYPDGTKFWFLNGKRHREDGPAVEWANGLKHWYLNGEKVTWQQVFRQAKNQEQQVRILIYVST